MSGDTIPEMEGVGWGEGEGGGGRLMTRCGDLAF